MHKFKFLKIILKTKCQQNEFISTFFKIKTILIVIQKYNLYTEKKYNNYIWKIKIDNENIQTFIVYLKVCKFLCLYLYSHKLYYTYYINKCLIYCILY